MRRRSGLASLLVVAGVGAILAGSLPTAVAAIPVVGKAPAIVVPQGNAKCDYQIGRAYDLPKGVKVVSRDREAKPARHAYNVCYVNAYQTQPQEIQWWKQHHNNLLLKKPGGGYVVDSYWGEVLLDVGTAKKRQAIAGIVNKWIAGCKADGFDAVEPDNLDSWTRSKGELTKSDNFDFAKLIIQGAHEAGLAIAQKNAAGQTALGRQDRLRLRRRRRVRPLARVRRVHQRPMAIAGLRRRVPGAGLQALVQQVGRPGVGGPPRPQRHRPRLSPLRLRRLLTLFSPCHKLPMSSMMEVTDG